VQFLFKGQEPAERVGVLLDLANLKSDDIKRAIHDHLVLGVSLSNASDAYEVHNGNVTRALKALNQVAAMVERIKEIDYAHLI